MIKQVKEYLKNKGLKIDDSRLKYIENGVDLSINDEFRHDFVTFPPHHNESWYFNFIDPKNNIYFVSRISFEMYEKISKIMLILIIDGEIIPYAQNIQVKEMPDLEFDKKIKYYCVEPMKKWRIKYEDRKIGLDITFNARFPVYNYLSAENPLNTIKTLGVELLEVTAQQHYEQGMKVTGSLILKKKDENRQINCLGHRDHSWGTRDWAKIDRWFWFSAQFEDETINIFRIEFSGKVLINGFYSNKEGNITIKNVEITTKTKKDGKTPMSSIYTMTDENGKRRIIESNTVQSIYLPLPSKEGFTEIYEQMATFKIEGKEGNGIAEYLISKR